MTSNTQYNTHLAKLLAWEHPATIEADGNSSWETHPEEVKMRGLKCIMAEATSTLAGKRNLAACDSNTPQSMES
eukprot:10732753-Alexandrium_andersonii.AAC.1